MEDDLPHAVVVLDRILALCGIPFSTREIWWVRTGTPLAFLATAAVWVCIVLALFGVRLYRRPEERAIVQWIAKLVFPAWASASLWGGLWYLFYASQVLPFGEEDYRGLKNTGEMKLLGFSVAGLTFASVFSATKARSRWWEARGHIGRIVAELKYLVGTGCHGASRDSARLAASRVCPLAKLYFSAVRAQLHGDTCQDLDDLWESEVSNNNTEAEGASLQPLHAGCEVMTMDAAVVSQDQRRIWREAKVGQRPMLTWQWLLAACDEVIDEHDAKTSALAMRMHESLRVLVEAYHGATKVKMHGKDRTALQVAEDFIYWMVLIGILPMSVARAFHVELTHNLLHAGASLWAVNSIPFALCLSSVVIFFGALRTVAQVSADPFVNDATEMKLISFEENLFADLDLMMANFGASK